MAHEFTDDEKRKLDEHGITVEFATTYATTLDTVWRELNVTGKRIAHLGLQMMDEVWKDKAAPPPFPLQFVSELSERLYGVVSWIKQLSDEVADSAQARRGDQLPAEMVEDFLASLPKPPEGPAS